MTTLKENVLIDFSKDVQNESWKIITDEVMGGHSTGNFQVLASGITAGIACFSGYISLKDNGGFCTTRVALNQIIDSNYKGIKIKVLGDGKTYSFRIKTNSETDSIQYKREFDTKEDTWLNIKLNFNEFDAVYRGKLIPDAPMLQPESIKEIGFLIANKQFGEFNLYTNSISIYN